MILFLKGVRYIISNKYKELYDLADKYYDNEEYEKCAEILLDLAKDNHAKSQYFLSILYSNGDGVEQDFNEEVKWLKKSADNGYVDAILDLAKHYLNGYEKIIPINKTNARNLYMKLAKYGNAEGQYQLYKLTYKNKYLKKAIKQNHLDAICEMGKKYEYDYKKRKIKKGIKWALISANQNHDESQNLLSKFYENLKQFEKSFYWAKKSADNKYPGGYYSLARHYEFSLGVLKDMNKAIELYKNAARLNLEIAIIYLADLYHEGVNVPQDYSKAREYYHEYLKKDKQIYFKKANIRLGIYYYLGLSVEKNLDLAFKHLNDCFTKNIGADLWMEKEIAEGLLYLARCYYYGEGTKKDFKQAFNCFEKSALLGNDEAQKALGILYQQGIYVAKDINKAIYWYEKSASLGNVDAQYNLGTIFSCGKGVDIDYKKAIYWYEKAVKQNDIDAQVNLGEIYYNGLGVKKDFKKAFELYERAANFGDSDAQSCLGTLYEKGKGVEKNIEKAIFWYEKAVEQNNICALYNLAVLYDDGVGVKQDFKKAFELYERAANLGDPKAQNNLGILYENGDGVEKNIEKAIYWFEKAVQQNDMYAQYSLGCLYENNRMYRCLEKSFELFKKSAEQGHNPAIVSLAKCYFYGRGVEQNYEKAFYWFEKAAINGDKEAQLQLISMYHKGIGVEKNYDKALYWIEQSEKN